MEETAANANGSIHTEPVPPNDRRASVRRAIELNRSFSAVLQIDDLSRHCVIHIVDVSEGGMKIAARFAFPENEHVELRIQLDDPVTVQVMLVWKKMVASGTIVMGLRFVPDEVDDRDVVLRFAERHSPEYRRRSFRINSTLTVELAFADRQERLYVLTKDLSPHGLRVMHDTPLGVGSQIRCGMLLGFGLPPISLATRIVWEKQIGPHNYAIGIEFLNVDPTQQQHITTYIARVVSSLDPAQG
ncbi:MAG: PilZ domain-containing protein [Candidatus Xenobia bacterium]